MSKRIVTYDPITTEILGCIFMAEDSQLENYSTVNHVEINQDEFDARPETYMHIVAGEMVPKAEVVITASKTTIDADGIDSAVLTFTGLVADATLKVEGTPVTVTVGTPTLTITSDSPKTFTVRLVDPLHVSNTVVVTAA